MDETLAFVIQLAQETGKILLDYYHSNNKQTNVKADFSVVTAADLAADSYISDVIRRKHPQDSLLSEELQSSLLDQPRNAIWVIDPLDGTTNYSLGLPFWGVSIARLVDGWPQIAVLFFPLLDELYNAQSGQGAFLNGEPIQVKPPIPNHPAAFFSCCGRTHRRYEVTVPNKSRILGSAAYSLCAVARGIAVLGFEATPKIWDIAATWLLVSEAGGVIETYDGVKPFPLSPGIEYSQKSYPTLAGATSALVAKARQQIISK